MSKPKVSVNLGSGRPGGLDISLAGLVCQTYQDFEVIFVDSRYHKRHRQVLEAVRRSGLKQPFYHVPNHRYRDDELGSTSAGYNTGFMLSAGEIVVMLVDYAYAPPNWLLSHMAYQDKKIILGPVYSRILHGAVTMDGKPPLYFSDRRNIDGLPFEVALKNIVDQRERYDEISLFREPFTPERLESFPVEHPIEQKCSMPTQPLSWTHFNTKNESFPLQAILDINGMDENNDRACMPGDLDLGMRLSRQLAATIWTVKEAMVHCINPRPILPKPINVMTSSSFMPPPFDRYLPIERGGYQYFDRIKTDPSIVRAPNPFEINKLKEEIWCWREMSQEIEPVIPRNVLSDNEYYKEPV